MFTIVISRITVTIYSITHPYLLNTYTMIEIIIQDLSLILTTTHQGGSPLQELGVLRKDEATCSGAQSERVRSQPRHVLPSL